VEALETEPFVIITDTVPGEQRLATLHLSISDATGDSAIVEYIDGKQVTHHDRSYQVMTNSPTFDKQLALDDYWQQIGGTVFLPGTSRAEYRFARASFYVNAIPKFEDPNLAVAGVFSVIRNVSVPYGISTPGQPNISSTLWRTVAQQRRKLYFFESALTPNTFWVNLNEIDFSAGTGKVMKLDLGPNQSNIREWKTLREGAAIDGGRVPRNRESDRRFWYLPCSGGAYWSQTALGHGEVWLRGALQTQGDASHHVMGKGVP